ncbi:MAG: 5-formyltetrahydrofolate cyclo-ligase [Pseudomonadota bacterium]
MSLAAAKVAARKAAFARRKAVHGTGLDAAAQARLGAYLAQWPGAALSGYMPILSEVDPLPVMSTWHGDVGVPVIVGKGLPLTFRKWTAEIPMVEGPFGAMVPEVGPEVVPRVLIVPLVAFDEDGYRLGYGGGFYDRTLAQLRASGAVTAIGFGYAAQKAETLPRETTDQRLDAIVTDAGVQTFDGP